MQMRNEFVLERREDQKAYEGHSSQDRIRRPCPCRTCARSGEAREDDTFGLGTSAPARRLALDGQHSDESSTPQRQWNM